MQRLTLGQAKAAIDLSGSTGIASCSPEFIGLLNAAQRYLADMGRWWGTTMRIYVCLDGNCITWPREVANVEAFKLCQRGTPIFNQWYEFQDAVCSPQTCGDNPCGPPMVLDRPSSPQFLDTVGDKKIRIYPRSATDAGKSVILQGTDASTNQYIRTQVGTTFISGEQLTLSAPFATSTFTFTSPGLVGVQKPVTNDTLDVYELDPDSGDEVKIAEWGPAERTPFYRRSYLNNAIRSEWASRCNISNGCRALPNCSNLVAEAIVRLEAVDAVVDSDWLIIIDPLALEHGMRAIQARRERHYQEAEIETQQALRILRNINEKYSPQRTMRINARPFGYASPVRIFGGFR